MIKLKRIVENNELQVIEFSNLADLIAYEAHSANEKRVAKTHADELLAKQREIKREKATANMTHLERAEYESMFPLSQVVVDYYQKKDNEEARVKAIDEDRRRGGPIKCGQPVKISEIGFINSIDVFADKFREDTEQKIRDAVAIQIDKR